MDNTKVLVIDDNKELVKMIKEYFSVVPNIDVVLEANDGKEGINLIDNRKDDFDIIVLDLVMPNKDGLNVLEYLHDNNIDKKVIVLTSYNAFIIITFWAPFIFVLKSSKSIPLEPYKGYAKRLLSPFSVPSLTRTLTALMAAVTCVAYS